METHVCRLNLEEDYHEAELRGTPMFPCAFYRTDLSKNVTGDVPWHWHEEIEIFTVEQGAARLHLDGLDVTIHEGEGAFINSNALHSASIASPEGCVTHAFVFSPSLLSGSPGSVFEQKYVYPLTGCRAFSGIALLQDSDWQRRAAALLEEAYDLYGKKDFGYELLLREKLSHLLYLILAHTPSFSENPSAAEKQDTVRIKEMMHYIQTHYKETVTLAHIAKAAHISERECLRCFKNALGIPPVQYLMKYRLSMAAGKLAETDEPVTKIAADCGFDSPSYFTQMFKRMFGVTPVKYRSDRLSQA